MVPAPLLGQRLGLLLQLLLGLMQKVLMEFPLLGLPLLWLLLLLLVLKDYHPIGGLAWTRLVATELVLQAFFLGLPHKTHLLAHLTAQVSSSNSMPSEAL